MQRYIRIAFWVWYVSAIVVVICAFLMFALDIRTIHPSASTAVAIVVGLSGLGLTVTTFFILCSDLLVPPQDRGR